MYTVTRFHIKSQNNNYSIIKTNLFQWNSKGYDVAKTWAPKFDYISPVWLQVQRQTPNIYIVSGLHDVDHAWMKTVKQKSANTNVKSMSIIH